MSYEMLKNRGRRRTVIFQKMPEHQVLPWGDSEKLRAMMTDQYRECSPASWAVEKTLDYVTMQTLQVLTDDPAFNDEFEREFLTWGEEADFIGIHSFDRMIELLTRHLFLDGDAGLLLVKGYKLQGIEGNRICRPTRWDDAPALAREATEDGLVLDRFGRIRCYIICGWDQFGYSKIFNAAVEPKNFCYVSNMFRFDQRRGTPPAANAWNTFQDIEEIHEASNLKVKQHAMLAVAFTSNAEDPDGQDEAEFTDPNDQEAQTEEPGTDELGRYDDFQLNVGTKVELEPGDDIKLLESSAPGSNYAQLTEVQLRKGFNSWGIPYSIWDSSKANYASMRVDRLELSRTAYRRWLPQVLRTRNKVLKFVLPEILRRLEAKGIAIPAGVTPEALPYEWITDTDPWIDELNEVNAAGERMDRGLSSHVAECKRRGVNAYRIINEEAKYLEYARLKGVTLTIGKPGQNVTETAVTQEEATNANR